MPDSISIFVGWPVPSLWQNVNPHWSKHRAATKAAREEAHALCLSHGVPASCPWPKAILHTCFNLPDGKRRDAFNMLAALKAHIDGVVDAGVIADDDWKHLLPGKTLVMPFNADQEPGVVLHLERVE